MSVSSLGAGSGVLTQTVIDQLKASDEATTITPIDQKITLQKQKSSALSLLNSLLTTFKSSTSALSDGTIYQQRSVSGNSDSVSVTANAGVAVQSLTINNTQMALKNVQESGSFSNETNNIATGNGTMHLTISGLSYDINYTSSTTLSSLKDAINNTAGESVKASVLQVGTGDYRLILTSNQTGQDQKITLSDSIGGTLNSKILPYDSNDNPTGMQEIQAARDASFEYNGINMTRSTNTITDIVTGVTINLLQDSGNANISITQNTQAISDELSSFTQNYNSLRSQLSNMTTSDSTAGTVGIFNGDNTINSISREINQIITSMNKDNLSLTQFGIDLNQSGVMSFNSTSFLAKFNQDPTALETFFSGSTKIDSNGNLTAIDGIFNSMDELLNKYTGTGGIISTLTNASTKDFNSLNENKKRYQELLDARYSAMSSRFVLYDTLMTRLNNQFSALKQQIDAAANGN